MKRLVYALWVLLPLTCFGEPECKICGGWGHGSSYGRLFNAATIQKVHGKVVAVNKIAPMDTKDYGISLLLDSGEEDIYVHLGPSWFVDAEPMKFAENDEIDVVGSKITVDGDPVIVATEVNKGQDKMLLRSSEGQPVWSGWKRPKSPSK